MEWIITMKEDVKKIFVLEMKMKSCLKKYFALCMESGGGNTASLSYTAGAAKYGISKNTFGRAIKELLDAGFISCAFEDNPNMYQTNVYRFCLDWRPP